MTEVRLQGVRRSLIAGTWYPGARQELADTVDEFLRQADAPPLGGELMGLVAPHAGYVYSGPVAGYAYKLLPGMAATLPKTVVIVGPSHRTVVSGVSVTAVESYETPLGRVPLDGDFLSALSDELDSLHFIGRDEEHSLEIQLPFLQRTLGQFHLVPIMMGDQSLLACRELGHALAKVLEERPALLIASTDLSHYHSYARAVALDRLVVDRVEAYDPVGLSELLEHGRAEACGGGPVVATMLAAQARGSNKAKVLHYANSGDITGDRGQVVGYMAAALYRSA